MSRQVEEKQLVSPPWQLTHSHITQCSTVPDFQNIQWSPPIRLTSPPTTFSYSPRWSCGWKGIVLTRLRRSTQKRKRLSTHSHLRTFRVVWNHGNHAGVAVCMSKGTTLKETVETRSYGNKLFLWSNSPNFWVAPHIMHWQSPFIYMEVKFGPLEKRIKNYLLQLRWNFSEHPFWLQKEWRSFGSADSRASWRETKKIQIKLAVTCNKNEQQQDVKNNVEL